MIFLKIIFCLLITPHPAKSCYNRRLRSMSSKRTISSFFKPLKDENDTKKSKVSNEITAESKIETISKVDTINTDTNLVSSKIIESVNISSSSQSILPELLNSLEDGWKSRLIKESNKPYFKSLDKFLQTELNGNKTNIYPPKNDIFSAFHLCPFENVKVVIIGQDPYHGPGQAHGLCFSVRKGIAPPPSLKNIFTELKVNDLCMYVLYNNKYVLY